ncbi:hypothetical protein [Mycetocola zhadangensis]|uniref:Uncharacterized protein n=1 Tax=Mycetocola zhadangensis TaxID=1164595 RepID=A0A3L7ITL5_9MICO|nr:hypothetical protein [Mycetocola zhadangensis]RLQ81470.1 hypothetical protein D9V28_14055 [Mycetocola zhadangensis]GGF01398.1 hypothetical protein GCM10011313_25640 [Mycetocola zhadangensis]
MNRSSQRPSRTESARSSLGTSQLGTGLAVAGALVVFSSLWRFSLHVLEYPYLPLNILAWVLLLAASTVTILVVRSNGFILGDLAFAVLVVMLVFVVAVDLVAVWGLSPLGIHPTAAIGVGGVLLGIVSIRPIRDVIVVTTALALTLIVSSILNTSPDPLVVGSDILLCALAVMPPLIGTAIVGSYRRMVMMALDRVLIQSTVDAPAYGVSMLESAELAAIDLEIERLFDDISSGREPLPLGSARADRAGALATELRRHLIAGRSHTWLHHAISESDFLSVSVELRDPDSLAGLLSQRQRDGLLSALWLLMYGEQRTKREAIVTLGPAVQETSAHRNGLRFPIQIEAKGMRRVDVEPATWQHLSRAGRYVDSTTPSALMVVIECTADNPIDH